MNVKTYLENLLKNSSRYELNATDKILADQLGMDGFIYSKLTAKKFRKTKMDEACVLRTKKAISLRLQKKLPLRPL